MPGVLCQSGRWARKSWRVRRAKVEDCSEIASVWLQSLAQQGHASWQWALKGGPEQQRKAVQELLEAKFVRKQKASAAARSLPSPDVTATVQLRPLVLLANRKAANEKQRSQGLFGQNGALKALMAARLRRWRQPFCLVVDGGVENKQEVLGYVLLSLSQPQALLPPPFPTTAPRRFYIEALAVLPRCHRQGMGSALLEAAEKLGRRLQYPSIWLQVGATNIAAQAMYITNCYSIVGSQGGWGASRQYLMQKNLTRPASVGNEGPATITNRLKAIGGAVEDRRGGKRSAVVVEREAEWVAMPGRNGEGGDMLATTESKRRGPVGKVYMWGKQNRRQ